MTDKVQNDITVWRGAFTASENGTLIFSPSSESAGLSLQWFDRSGKITGTIEGRDNYNQVQVSPDGTKIAIIIGDPKGVLWVYDQTRKNMTRMTFEDVSYDNVIWSPDGTQLAFNGTANGLQDSTIRTKPISGTGEQKQLLGPENSKAVPSSLLDWSPDGKNILFSRPQFNASAQGANGFGYRYWILPLTGDKKPYPYSPSTGTGTLAKFSPDGHWVAYQSSETGRNEIFVSPFPWTGAKWQVSTNGGEYPFWKKDGKELIFDVPGLSGIYAVEVDKRGKNFSVVATRKLFRAPFTARITNTWAVTADNQRFLIITSTDSSSQPPLTVVQNWTGLLEKK